MASAATASLGAGRRNRHATIGSATTGANGRWQSRPSPHRTAASSSAREDRSAQAIHNASSAPDASGISSALFDTVTDRNTTPGHATKLSATANATSASPRLLATRRASAQTSATATARASKSNARITLTANTVPPTAYAGSQA